MTRSAYISSIINSANILFISLSLYTLVLVYDSSLTRDIFGQKLQQDPTDLSIFSTDTETQTRFLKRLPFQVESCWSGAIILRASNLSSIPFSDPFNPQDYQSVGQCNQTDDRVKLIQYLRQSSSAFESYSPRVIVVPSIPFPYSSKDYVNQGRFNGWGLWPKTEKQYRDQLESKLEAESRHPLYGYRPSTASYGYILRVKKDGDQDPFVEGMEKDEKSSEADVEKWGAESLVVSEEVTVALKTKLEEIGAAFGVQDIQNAVILKTEGEMIGKWRERSASSAWEC
ncbi:hypothetical protein BC939DRAFT_158481 [Gamsiella multidivaricata]|uniref:uncharacterized protein n=1 Tax=Gamsiella multidivaricata TaxID=101098 RepID=UPI0022203DD3|nr:uncharacterized protein BC939DRAFT_158481 [Gamsiella multidivaricata]KAI7823518.1 hypothetical protein BC939DRAFT_158481 [Gamsiella multidivaricata]